MRSRSVHNPVRGPAITVLLCLAPLAAGAVPLPGGEGAQGFLFDGHPVADPGLIFTFSRASATVDDAGRPLDFNQARYAGDRLLCGAPGVQTMPDTAGYGSVNILGAGLSNDNTTPMLVLFNSDLERAEVRLGAGGEQVYAYNAVHNPDKGNQGDFLRESADGSPDEAWSIRAAIVCHGMAVAMCNVAVRDGQGAFLTNRIGFATCNARDLAGPKQLWWRRLAVSDVLTPCTDSPRMGNTWAMQTWFAPGQEGAVPTRFWAAATDYRNGACKDGGVYCLFPVTRSGPGADDWTADAPFELPGRFALTTFPTHAHALALCRLGAGGLIAMGSRGDSLFNNVDYTWTLWDESQYRAGASVPPGAFNYYTGTAGQTAWSPARQVNGSITTPDAPISTRALGNQWVAAVPGPVPGTVLAGADEVSQPIWLSSSLSGDPAHVEYTPLYGAGPTNWVQPPGYAGNAYSRFLCFHIAPAEPRYASGAYVAHLGPGGGDSEHLLNARLLYSPDGAHWGQAWAHGEDEQASVAFVSGRVYAGSAGLNTRQGVRWTSEPAARLIHPLRVAPGATNYIAPAALAPVDVPPGVHVQLENVPGSPGVGPVAHIVMDAPVSAPSDVGVLRLATGIPGDAGTARLRLWVRADTLAEGGAPGSVGVQFALSAIDPTVGPSSERLSSFASSTFLPGSGTWTPVVLSCNLGAWAAQDAPIDLNLVVSPAGGQWVPGSFRIAADLLAIGDMLPAPAAPQSVSAEERASVTGFALPGDWTAVLAGAVPFDAWDSTAAKGSYWYCTLASLVTASGNDGVEIVASPILNALQVWVVHDGVIQPPYVTLPNIYYTAGSPVLVGLSYDKGAGRLVAHASVGGTDIASGTIEGAGLDDVLTEVRFAPVRSGATITPMDWFGGTVEGRRWGDAEIDGALRSLDFVPPSRCLADFDGNGFVNGEDFDAFSLEFFYGGIRADVDHNGYVNGEDFDAFGIAFDQGC